MIRGRCAHCRRHRPLTLGWVEVPPFGQRGRVCGPCRDRLLESEVKAIVQVDRGVRRWREAVAR